jgi:hypothetical protein
MSGSAVIKSTIFQEWFSVRLVPWKHFIPLDSRFGDLWTILDYFSPADNETSSVHDEQARMIGQSAATWARKVIRREDMKLYVYRLILELYSMIKVSKDGPLVQREFCSGKSDDYHTVGLGN